MMHRKIQIFVAVTALFPAGFGWAKSGSVASGPRAAGTQVETAQQGTKAAAVSGPWEMQESHTTASLRGIHAVGAGVAWASGTDGTVLRTEDGGYLWQKCAVPPNAEKLDFRGVWAWDAQTAVVMSSGTGDLSRLYKTTDGCQTWKLLYTNPDAKGFWDAVAFWDRTRGSILGDPVDGAFVLLDTDDGGATWTRSHTNGLKADPSRAGAFAASNSSIAAFPSSDQDQDIPHSQGRMFIGTGGVDGARVYFLELNASTNKDVENVGLRISVRAKWTSAIAPLASGNESSGVFSLAFRDSLHGMAVGGDYKKPDESRGTAAWTVDGGQTWHPAVHPPHGYRSALAWDAADEAWITAGTNGSDVSFDDGKLWGRLDDGSWNALSLPWVVGPKGRIAKLVSLKGITAGSSGSAK